MGKASKVLFLSSCVRGGGAGWSLYYLLKNLDRRRFDPLVVVPDLGIFEEKFREMQVRVHVSNLLPHRTMQQRFSSNNRLTRSASAIINVAREVAFVRELSGLIRREGIALVYCNNMMVKPLGASAAQICGVPCVLHVRNIHETFPAKDFYPSLARLPMVKRIISNSTASAEPYRQVAEAKVRVVHNGIDLDEYDPDKVPKGDYRKTHGFEGEFLVGYTGNLIPRKGLIPLIHAAARVLPDRPNLRFVAVGRVPVGMAVDHLAEYRALAWSLGIGERFLFTGFVPDVRPAVNDFDVLALPSFQEPFGRSIIEAMALGTPVVASRVGGIPEIIDDGVHGLLVPPGDDEGLARAIASLHDSADLRKRLSEAARQRVEEHFDVNRLTFRIQDLFDEAISA